MQKINSDLLYVEGLGFRPSDGEAVALWFAEDDDGKPHEQPVVLAQSPTGWHFQEVIQAQPDLTTGGVVWMPIAPWNYPTNESLNRLTWMVRGLGVDVLGIDYDSINERAPILLARNGEPSAGLAKAPRLQLGFGDKRVTLAAGQTIRYMCAHVYRDGSNGFVRVLREQIEEAERNAR